MIATPSTPLTPPVQYSASSESGLSNTLRQISELVISVLLLAFAWGAFNRGDAGELVGGVVGTIATYWINKGMSNTSTSRVQESTARALNGPLHAINQTQIDVAAEIARLREEVNSVKVVNAGIAFQQRKPSEPVSVSVVPADEPLPVAVVSLKPGA